MITKNRKTLKKIIYAGLFATALFPQARATQNTFEDERNRSGKASKFLSDRENRLCLFGLDKFDNSFNIMGNIEDQMNKRNAIWIKAYLQEYIKKEVIFPNHNKIIEYIPYYLKQILDIKSPGELRIKKDFFSDFINIMNVIYGSLNNRDISTLNQELSKINLEEYPLSPIFFRFIALKTNQLIYSSFPSSLKEKMDMIWEDEKFNGPNFTYHKSLKDKYKEDQKILESLSYSLNPMEHLKGCIILHNIGNG